MFEVKFRATKMQSSVKGNTAFGLLWLELGKLARQALQLFAGLLLIVAILNSGLGASLILSETPDPLSSAGFSEPSARLVHLQLFGGLVHLHEHNPSDHLHFPQGYQAPPGVTEFLVAGDDDPGDYSLSTYSDVPTFGKIDYTSGWSQNTLFALLSVLGLLALNSLAGRLSQCNQLVPADPHLKRLERPPISF
jgi:hypothetical protein